MTRVLAAVVCSVGLLSVCSCLPVPLGDPEKSAIDPRFLGAWTWADGGQTNVVVFRPWDQRTYLVDAMGYTGDPSAPVPKYRSTYKAWLTTVKGVPFVTLQPADTLAGAPANDKRKYLIAMLSLDADQLVATPLDGDYKKFREVGTATELEKVVTANFDDVKMWGKPIAATKLNEGGPPDLEKLGKAFETR
ncbi:MAG: hypothetical protein ACAI43_01100 [Phycisphaerae bacterium]